MQPRQSRGSTDCRAFRMPIYFGLLTGLLAAPTGDRSQRVGKNEPRWDRDHSGQVGNAAWIARKWDLPPLEHVRFVDRRARRADRADRHAEDRGVVPSQRSALLVRLSQCDRFYPIPLRRAVKRCVAAARCCSGASAGMAQQEPTKHERTGERTWTQGRDGREHGQSRRRCGRGEPSLWQRCSQSRCRCGRGAPFTSGVDVARVSAVPAQMWEG